MRYEQQQEVLSQLREVYDGSYVKKFGNGKVIDWEGHVGFIGACTPAYDSRHSVIAQLGERFLLYRANVADNQRMGMQAQAIVGREKEMRSEIKGIVHAFLNRFKNLHTKKIKFESDEFVSQQIVALAVFCAHGRCGVDRDRYNQTIKYCPLPEGSPRLVKQLMQVGMGLALVRGEIKIDDNIYQTIKKIGRDILPANRQKALQYLWDERCFEALPNTRTTTEVAKAVNLPPTTTRLILEDLMIVEMLIRHRDDKGGAPWEWQISQRAYELMAKSQVFDEGD